MTDTSKKVYPHKEEDITYEKEIVDAIKKLPLEQRFQAIALNHYTLIKKHLEGGLDEEIDVIIQKYNKLQKPLIDRGNEIISGEKAPTEEEIQEVKQYLSDEEKGNLAGHLTAEPLPEYWFKVLTKCGRLSQDIFEPDHPLLKKITKIDHIPEENSENFEIRFYFAPNEYFENDVLKVKFIMVEDGEPGKTEGTEIKWKEGKDFTKKKVSKKQKNKKTGKTRTVEKVVDADSFFNTFKTIEPERENGEGGDEEDENVERLGINFEIATVLQEEIVPYHLEYYLGLRKGEDYGWPQGGEGDDDDEGSDDDEPEEKPKKN